MNQSKSLPGTPSSTHQTPLCPVLWRLAAIIWMSTAINWCDKMEYSPFPMNSSCTGSRPRYFCKIFKITIFKKYCYWIRNDRAHLLVECAKRHWFDTFCADFSRSRSGICFNVKKCHWKDNIPCTLTKARIVVLAASIFLPFATNFPLEMCDRSTLWLLRKPLTWNKIQCNVMKTKQPFTSAVGIPPGQDARRTEKTFFSWEYIFKKSLVASRPTANQARIIVDWFRILQTQDLYSPCETYRS